MSELTLQQQLAIEGTAAQLYEQDAALDEISVPIWAMAHENVKTRWRATALRKLKTGELDGWFKLCGAGSHREHARQVRVAGGGRYDAP